MHSKKSSLPHVASLKACESHEMPSGPALLGVLCQTKPGKVGVLVAEDDHQQLILLLRPELTSRITTCILSRLSSSGVPIISHQIETHII